MDLLKLFTREEPIAGMEISDSYIRLILLAVRKAKVVQKEKFEKSEEKKKNFRVFPSRPSGIPRLSATTSRDLTEIKAIGEKPLPAGMITDGRLKDKDGFVKIVSGFLKEIKPPIRYAVVSIPADAVYFKLYFFPKIVGGDRLKESMRTIAELQMPFNPKDFYIDWEKMENKEGNLVFLASASREAISEYMAALALAGIAPVAIEPHPLSIVRSLAADASPALIMNFSKSGVSLSVVENKIIYFNRFVPFSFLLPFDKNEQGGILKGAHSELVKGGKGGLNDFLAKEIRKITDFFEADKNKKISQIIAVGEGVEKFNISPLHKEPVPHRMREGKGDLAATAKIIEPFSANPEIQKNNSKWLAAAGVALRGIIPRSDDTLVSFLPVGTEEAYENQKAVAFAEFISSAAIGISIFFAVVFFGVWLLMISLGKNVNERISFLNSLPAPAGASLLEARAKNFNELAAKTSSLLADMPYWSAFLEELKLRMTNGINISGLSLPSPAEQMSISGVALNRAQLNLFKKSLEESSWLAEVVMPLTNLAQKDNIPFSISFWLKDPNIIQIYK
ncbi:pilus assembly protein PilM [Candidatus Falkowbacteria bacterium]|nr:pilus assembly protein PilM [Candidatus Falkowbacteria bacterium]